MYRQKIVCPECRMEFPWGTPMEWVDVFGELKKLLDLIEMALA